MKSMIKNNKLYLFSALIIYILILIPSLNVPFQSDDYSYFLKGISLEKTISHYMGWSGRLITDFTSSFLLKYLPYIIYESINSLVFLCMCVFVSIIPIVISNSEKVHKGFSSTTLWIIFLAYWISNPNLGQTSFWIVGSANYLWTIMWAASYIAFILYLINIRISINKIDYFCLFILGLLAGCSNENTAISIVFFSFLLFFIEKKRKIITIGFISNILGMLVLILAPGNSVRKQYFTSWYDRSTLSQLFEHILYRMPNSIHEYLHIYLIIIAALIILIFLNKKINEKSIIYCGIFFILSIFSNVVLTKSPYIGGRNLNTGLFWLLPTLAIIIYEYQYIESKIVRAANGLLLTYSFLFFIPSYILFTFMMIQANAQHKIREEIIQSSKSVNKQTANIPEWYFTKLLKDSDKFDTFKSGAMPTFYGIQSINYFPVNFNYAAIINGDQISLDKPLKEKLKLLKIYNYVTNVLPYKKNGLVFEFNDSIKKYILEGDTTIFIHLHKKTGGFINADRSINNEVEINGKFYIDTSMGNISISDIDKIIIGFYNSNTGKNSAVFEIEFS